MNNLNRYDDLPEKLGEAIALQMIESGAADRVKSSALATLANHRKEKRKLTTERVLTAIAIIWVCGSFGFWLVGKLPFALAGVAEQFAQSEGNKVTAPVVKDSSQPRLLRINLTLSDPKDLKVKQGDFLQENQVISDREDERKRLQSQREQYLTTIKILSLEPQKPLEPLPIKNPPKLPDQSFAEYEAEIDLQRLKIKSAEERINLKSRQIDLIGTMDKKDLPEGIEAHENQKLADLQTNLKKEEGELQLRLGKFESEKSKRALEEYRSQENSVRYSQEQNKSFAEYQRSLAEFNRSEQERNFRLADLRSKVGMVEDRLKEISTVRAQYAAEVKRVRFVKQVNNEIDVELLLYVSDRTDKRIRSSNQAPSKTLQPFTKSNN